MYLFGAKVAGKGIEMDEQEQIQKAAQELVDFLNEKVLKSPEQKTNVSDSIAGVDRWVRVFRGNAEVLQEYHERWTKLAKLIAETYEFPA